MKRIYKYILLCFIVLQFITTVNAQKITMEQTLEYINKNVGDKCTVEIKKQLIVKFYKNGEIYRQDKVYIEDLDSYAVVYLHDEKAVILKCKEGIEECIERRLYVNKIKRAYSRLSIIVNSDEKAGKGLEKAFIHLIKLVQEPRYKSSEPFE